MSEYIGLLYSQRTSDAYPNAPDSEIYTVRGDGSTLTPLTDNPWLDQNPTWSHDGSQILWKQWDGIPEAGSYDDLWVMDTDGSNARNLTDMPGREWGKWSPANTLIAFRSYNESAPSGQESSFYLTTPTAVTPTLIMESFALESFEWSPDGSSLAFTVTRIENDQNVYDLYRVSADGTGLALLATQSNSTVEWSPDGAWLGYQQETDGNLELYITRVDGSETRRLTQRTQDDYFRGWVEGGRRVLVQHLTDEIGYGATDLVTVADGVVQPFISQSGWIEGISPDGTQVVISVTPPYEPQRLYLQHTNSMTPIPISPEFAFCSFAICNFTVDGWSADGRTISYTYSEFYTYGSFPFLLIAATDGNTQPAYHQIENGRGGSYWLPYSSTWFAASANSDIGPTIKMFNSRTGASFIVPNPPDTRLIQSEWRYEVSE